MKAKLLIQALSVAVPAVLLISSCTLESDEYVTVDIPSSLSLSVGESYDFGQESSSLSSNNDFVITVEEDGVAVAKHAGKCQIRFSNYWQESTCAVTVFPNTTLYSEPIRQWGMRKSALISIEGDNYRDADNNTIGYMMDSSTVPLKIYAFEDDALIVSGVVVKISSSERLAEHLLDRYQPIVAEGNSYLFIDSYSLNGATTAVYMTIYSTEYWAVMYMDINYFESMNYTKAKMPEDLFGDITDLLK